MAEKQVKADIQKRKSAKYGQQDIFGGNPDGTKRDAGWGKAPPHNCFYLFPFSGHGAMLAAEGALANG